MTDMTADILVQYADSREAEDALDIKETINSIQSEVTATRGNMTSIDESNWKGVIVLGGEAANPVAQHYNDVFGWDKPDETNNPLLPSVSPTVITDISTRNNTKFVKIAGMTANDTDKAVAVFLGEHADELLEDPLNLRGAAVDDFVDAVRAMIGSVEDPTDDPGGGDPITDPDTGSGDFNLTKEDMEHSLSVSIHPFAPSGEYDYTIKVAGRMIADRDTLEDNDSRPIGSSEVMNQADKPDLIGFIAFQTADLDRYWFDGKISEVQCDVNLLLEVDGNQYRYNATKDKIEATKGPFGGSMTDLEDKGDAIAEKEKSVDLKQKEKEADQGFFGAFMETLADIFQGDSPIDRAAQVSIIILGLLLANRGLDAINNIGE